MSISTTNLAVSSKHSLKIHGQISIRSAWMMINQFSWIKLRKNLIQRCENLLINSANWSSRTPETFKSFSFSISKLVRHPRSKLVALKELRSGYQYPHPPITRQSWSLTNLYSNHRDKRSCVSVLQSCNMTEHHYCRIQAFKTQWAPLISSQFPVTMVKTTRTIFTIQISRPRQKLSQLNKKRVKQERIVITEHHRKRKVDQPKFWKIANFTRQTHLQ